MVGRWKRWGKFAVVGVSAMLAASGCSKGARVDTGASTKDGGPGTSAGDGSNLGDPGVHPGSDGGVGGGTDGGGVHGGGADGGVTFGGPGPWPLDNETYGAANGIKESPILSVSTDETQNLWVATQSALYLLQPGQTMFKRFDASAGLHLQSNPVTYCDTNFGSTCPATGAAVDPGIRTIVGGGDGEVFVGYWGIDYTPGFVPDPTTASDKLDPNRHSGKIDRIRLKSDGTLQVDRIDMVAGAHGAQFWHNRTVERMLFDHFIHPHDLYVGSGHGVDFIKPDRYRAPNPGEWFDAANLEYMADHLHARVCFHETCPDNSEAGQRMGDWRGLALDSERATLARR